MLFGAPDRRFYTNEIFRLADVGVGAVQRELVRLASAGLLRVTKEKNRKYYQANPDSPIFEELRKLVAKISDSEHSITLNTGNKTHRRIRISPEALAALCERHHIRKLSLFGSTARQDSLPGSDIDLLVEFKEKGTPSLMGMVKIKQELSTLFGSEDVELATPSILVNPYRRCSILRDLKELYAA